MTSSVLAVALSLAAAPPAPAASGSAVSSSSVASGGQVHLSGDTAVRGGARGGFRAWRTTRLYYYETLPAKWDWSLSTAVGKWNGAGARLRLVRTPYRSRAALTIGYGYTAGAAGMATVGATRSAWVHLSPTYRTADATDPSGWNRVAVMAILTHELGHVLGFGHSTARCSLMAPVLDFTDCGVLPRSLPGYYKCRTVEPALARRFVAIYGGSVRYPGTWCPVDTLPPALTGAALSGGAAAGAPVSVRWDPVVAVPVGSTARVRTWPVPDGATTCGGPPAWARERVLATTAGAWTDTDPESLGSACVQLRSVNRYGTSRTALTRLVERWAAPDPVA